MDSPIMDSSVNRSSASFCDSQHLTNTESMKTLLSLNVSEFDYTKLKHTKFHLHNI